MKALLIVLLFPLMAVAEDSSLLVGNAGEGVIVAGKLFVLDLYESGSHARPQFSSAPVPADIAKAVRDLALVADLGVNSDLLAAKVAELDSYSPDFAAYFLTVARYYHWVLLPAPLLPFPSEGRFMGLDRIPLANRLDGSIRVAMGTWGRLSDEHRVALVVHEVLSAMQRLFWENGAWNIDGFKLREMVGILFSTYGDKSGRFRQYAIKRLAIPSEDYRRAHPGAIMMNVRSYVTPQGTYQDTIEFGSGPTTLH